MEKSKEWNPELVQLVGEVAIKLGSEKADKLAELIKKHRTIYAKQECEALVRSILDSAPAFSVNGVRELDVPTLEWEARIIALAQSKNLDITE